MNPESERYLAERTRDQENGNILTYDPDFDPSKNGFDSKNGNDLQLSPAEDRLNALHRELQAMRALEADGGLSEEELEVAVLLETEVIVEEYAQQMIELAEEHPVYTWHVGVLLAERLDELKSEGYPVDAEMYLEAEALADEIVKANPDKNANELKEIVETMVELNKAQAQRRRALTLVAA